VHRPCPSAEPRACLHHEAINMCVHEPPARGDTSGAGAHNENLGITAGHGLSRGGLDRDVRLDRPTDRAVATMPVHAVSMPILSRRSKRQQRLFAIKKSTPTRALLAVGPRKPCASGRLSHGPAGQPQAQSAA
jgi:hypothetical protein